MSDPQVLQPRVQVVQVQVHPVGKEPLTTETKGGQRRIQEIEPIGTCVGTQEERVRYRKREPGVDRQQVEALGGGKDVLLEEIDLKRRQLDRQPVKSSSAPG
jgi:hypothetical protein